MSHFADASKRFLFPACLLLVALGLVSLTHASGKRKPPPRVVTPPRAVTPSRVAPPSPYVYGQWEPGFTSASVVSHAAVLPNGKVLHWSPNAFFPFTAPTWSRLWTCVLTGGLCDPDVSSANLQNVYYYGSDLFCSGHSFLPDGRLFTAGGNVFGGTVDGSRATAIFDLNPSPSPSPPATSGPNMANYRWYPTTVTLGNGETAILSGLNCESSTPPCPINNTPEVLNAAGTALRTLSTAANVELPLYPRMFLASDGRLFYAGPNSPSRWLNTTGTGSWGTTTKPYYCPDPPNCITDRSNGSAVMYDVDKVLMAGGGQPPTELAQTIDLTNEAGSWTETESMANARRHLDLTILADGKVLATGGTSGDGFNNPCPKYLVYEAELWDPDTGTNGAWSPLASMTRRRAYHSFAVLLVDGRVLVGGNTGAPETKSCPANEPEYQQEIFTPPYLFNSDGTPATRPTISYAPEVVNYNSQFLLLAPNAVSLNKVTMVRLSSVTHSINFNQRFNKLTFSRVGNGLRVNTPANSNLAPPGHYMLFVINNANVPSVAKIIKIE